MKRVTGVGGIFFKARDEQGMRDWYERHLGITPAPDGHVSFRWRELEDPQREAMTAWDIFPANTTYFDPSRAPFMINYRVANLEELLSALREEGVPVDDRVEEYEYGKFG